MKHALTIMLLSLTTIAFGQKSKGVVVKTVNQKGGTTAAVITNTYSTNLLGTIQIKQNRKHMPSTVILKGATIVVDVFKQVRIIDIGTPPEDIKCDIVSDLIVEDSLGDIEHHFKNDNLKVGGIYTADIRYHFSPSNHESMYDDDCDVTVENIKIKYDASER